MRIIKTVLYFVVMALIVAILSVGIHAFFDSSQDDSSSRVEIGLVLTDSKDRWERVLYDNIGQLAEKQGLRVTTAQCGRSLAEQVEVVRQLMAKGATVIIFSPLMDGGWSDTLLQAKELGVELLTVNESISDRVPEGSEVRHVGYDYEKVGSYLGTHFLNRTQGKTGRYISLLGSVTSYTSNQIAEGFQQSLLEKGSGLSAFGVSGDYDRTQAHMVVNGLLESGYEFQELISYGDGMTLGAIDALRENGLAPGRDVHIYAVGGTEEIMEAFQDGEINVLLRCDPVELAQRVISNIVPAEETGGEEQETLLSAGVLLGV